MVHPEGGPEGIPAGAVMRHAPSASGRVPLVPAARLFHPSRRQEIHWHRNFLP